VIPCIIGPALGIKWLTIRSILEGKMVKCAMRTWAVADANVSPVWLSPALRPLFLLLSSNPSVRTSSLGKELMSKWLR
jgi:hypothetical protein